MASVVNLGAIQLGSATNNIGFFNGQNIQNAWDSHSPNLSNMGTLMGSFSVEFTCVALFSNIMPIGQPIIDSDIKNNASPSIEGP